MGNVSAVGNKHQVIELDWTINDCRRKIESTTQVIQTEQQKWPKFQFKYSLPFEIQSFVRTGVCKKREICISVSFKIIAVPVQLAYEEDVSFTEEKSKLFQRGLIVGIEPVGTQSTIHGTLQIVAVNSETSIGYKIHYESAITDLKEFGFIPSSALIGNDIKLKIKLTTWTKKEKDPTEHVRLV